MKRAGCTVWCGGTLARWSLLPHWPSWPCRVRRGRRCREHPSATGILPGPPEQMAFPVEVSGDKRYLVDQDGKPWLMIGDSPQCMTGNLSVADMDVVLRRPGQPRVQHGMDEPDLR